MSRQEQIIVGNIPVTLVKNNRATHILLKQNTKGKIILTCPRLCPKILAVNFAKKQLPWIQAHVQHGPTETVFQPNQTIQIMGKTYCVILGKRTQETEDTLTISGDTEFFHRRVCSFAQKKLLPYIQQKALEYAQQISVKYSRITLRNTSSRWGSCSSNHNLSFCWKIAFAPLYVIDYLVAHEVSHLSQMNHSIKFWQVVDSLTTTRKKAEKWLKENGRNLQSIR